MSINFENKEARTEYLNQKLDNLLSGINSTYGQALLDELIVRLTRIISDFNEEVEKIMGNLKDNSEKKSKIIHELMEGKEVNGDVIINQIVIAKIMIMLTSKKMMLRR